MDIKKVIEMGASEELAKKIVQIADAEKKEAVKAEREKLEKVIIESALESKMEECGTVCYDAVLAMLDFDTVRVENGVVARMDEELERLMKMYPVLFRKKDMPYAVWTAEGAGQDKVGAVREAMGI